MEKYEFVSKKEYQPIRNDIEKIINKVQNLVRDRFTFRFKLVGSGGRHLITRVVGGNKGYDFDYNLILNSPDENHFWKPCFARETLFKAFQSAIKGTTFNKIENSKSAITIKSVDYKNSKVVQSCDFAVIYYPNDEEYSYFKYARYNKHNNVYTWEIRNSSINVDEKLNWIKENVDSGWEIVKEEYLKIKNSNNDLDKHSFQLYIEAINNVYNKEYYQQEEYDDDWE